jgi:hypothetical protein
MTSFTIYDAVPHSKLYRRSPTFKVSGNSLSSASPIAVPTAKQLTARWNEKDLPPDPVIGGRDDPLAKKVLT